jgi:hypothetical protein
MRYQPLRFRRHRITSIAVNNNAFAEGVKRIKDSEIRAFATRGACDTVLTNTTRDRVSYTEFLESTLHAEANCRGEGYRGMTARKLAGSGGNVKRRRLPVRRYLAPRQAPSAKSVGRDDRYCTAAGVNQFKWWIRVVLAHCMKPPTIAGSPVHRW